MFKDAEENMSVCLCVDGIMRKNANIRCEVCYIHISERIIFTLYFFVALVLSAIYVRRMFCRV